MARRFLPGILLALTTVTGMLPAATATAARAPFVALSPPPPPPVSGTQSSAPATTDPYPSTGDIAAARAEADRRAAASTAIEARLTAAEVERDRAHRAAEQAVESYNGAQARLARARTEESDALQRAAVAELARHEAAEDAAGLAAETYRQGTTAELSAIDALLGARGPHAAGAQAAVIGVISSRTRQILDAATGTAAAAVRASAAAREAAAAAERAAAQVRTAKDNAQASTRARQTQVAEIGRRREQLLTELAAARNTTVGLERRRRDALEAIAAREAEAAARAAAEAAAAAAEKAAAEQAAAEKAAAEQAAAERAAAEQPAAAQALQAAGETGDTGETGEAGETGDAAVDRTAVDRTAVDRAAAPLPPPGAGRWSATGAAAAIAFARSKIGLPYVWGGEGPDGYDCSGLTMMAWRAGGRRVPHFAADQYARSTPLTYRQLRPGDLVFWTDTGRAADIYHVALYIGDDQMIEAPRAGMAIKQASLWIMGTPDFYARP
ncbi:NlpC/P60 family protein [Kitasatospora sp. NPDC057223]|uniref:C40 family peptidase n=1 Tax=Kitasatospora sp. NPDC057223 TaxID=3346055 RepID=UPI003630C6E0